MQLGSGDNSILNNGTFNLRHFADTNGDGVRDTIRVAIADLGTAQATILPTTERWRSPQVTGATMLDSTGQYLPLGNPNNKWRSAGRCRAS